MTKRDRSKKTSAKASKKHKKSTSSFRKWLISLSVLSFLVIGGVGVTAYWLWELPNLNNSSVRIDVQRGDTLTSMAERWQRDGWLRSALLLRVTARLTKQTRVLRPGEYDIPAGLTNSELLALLASAKAVTYRLTIIEGRPLREALAVIAKAPHLTQDIEPLTTEAVAKVIGVQGNPEGWLYPDTYVYQRHETASAIILQAYQRMQDNLAEAWQNRASGLPYRDAYQALIMASIVEKETGAAYERPMIAGVFVRRLQKNMRLETDPTVIYGLGPEFDGNLTRAHLRDSSNRYNTYRRHGLPPSPIALAGRTAIDAALHPQDGDALYFVAKGDGSHAFSATLAAHNAAVRKYQMRRREDYRSAPKTEQ